MAMRVRCHLIIVLLLLSLPVMGRETVPDIRVAIDVSGSMKKNDPRQLRTPALKLLVGLLPQNSYAGVWTFGQYVNMEVKQGKVDEEWKARARAAAERIHSRARFTNIEEAIQRASYNWNKADSRYNRNLILLTDGMLDITRDAEVNEASRRRIQHYWIPILQKAGVRVHCIALSQDADKQLMTMLSSKTGGWYEQVDNAEQLERVFLRLFEKSVKQDSVPLKGNRFSIDTNVRDMTLLVFNKSESGALKISTPGGERWSEHRAPGHVSWFHEEGYDLVTVKKPQSGVWVLETESDPDNRVMVVTNLKLKTSKLPDHVVAGEIFNLEARLSEKDRTVSNRDFLKLVQFSLLQQHDNEVGGESLVLLDDGKNGDRAANDGIYFVNPSHGLKNGLQTLILRADGATFQRELRHTLNVHPDYATVKAEKHNDMYKLTVEINHFVADVETAQLSVSELQDKVPTWVRHENRWETELPVDKTKHELVVNMTVSTFEHEKIHRSYPLKLMTEKEEPDAGKHPSEVIKHESEHESGATANREAETGEHNEHAVQETDGQAKHDETDWTMIIWLTVLINLILIITGILAWLYLKKKRASDIVKEDAEIKV